MNACLSAHGGPLHYTSSGLSSVSGALTPASSSKSYLYTLQTISIITIASKLITLTIAHFMVPFMCSLLLKQRGEYFRCVVLVAGLTTSEPSTCFSRPLSFGCLKVVYFCPHDAVREPSDSDPNRHRNPSRWIVLDRSDLSFVKACYFCLVVRCALSSGKL